MQQAIDSSVILAGSVTGTSYAPSRSDAGRVLEASNASAITITIPAVSVAGWIVGSVIEVYQMGAGQVTLAGAGSVTLRSSGGKLKTAAQYSVVWARMRANDEWVVYGDTAA
jgi:hypothetical protein